MQVSECHSPNHFHQMEEFESTSKSHFIMVIMRSYSRDYNAAVKKTPLKENEIVKERMNERKRDKVLMIVALYLSYWHTSACSMSVIS